MRPELQILGLTLHSYNVMAWFAAAAGAALVWFPLRRLGWPGGKRAALLLGMCAAFLVGARLWNVAANPANYRDGFHWYTFRMAGLSLYGGIFGAGAVLLCVARKDAWRALDAFVIPSGVAFCIARVGCFLNGCCKGVRTDSVLGVVFPSKLPSIRLGPLGSISLEYAVHATQLYELLGAAAGLPVCMILAKRWKQPEGGLFLLYGVWFCLVRLAVLPLRSLNYPDIVKNVAYPMLYFGLAAFGTVLLLQRRQKTV